MQHLHMMKRVARPYNKHRYRYIVPRGTCSGLVMEVDTFHFVMYSFNNLLYKSYITQHRNVANSESLTRHSLAAI